MSDNKEVHALSVDQLDTLKASAENFGFDGGAVADILTKFGPDVLSLLVEAARSGFNVAWIMETLNKFGPTVFQFFTDLWSKNMSIAPQAMSMDGEVATGVLLTGPVVEGMDSNLLSTLLEKFLPMLLEKYGPQLIQLLMDAVLNAITPKVGAPADQVAAARLQGALLQNLLEKLLPVILEKYGPVLIQKLMDAILDAVKSK